MRFFPVFVLALTLAALPCAVAQAYDGQWHLIGSQGIWIAPPAGPAELDRALLRDLTATLRNYKPAPHDKISNLSVRGNGTWAEITFKVDTSVVTSVDFGATASAPRRSNNCDKSAVTSYYLEFDLVGSEKAVRRNASAFGLDMCVFSKGEGGGYDIQSKLWVKEGYDADGSFNDFKKFLLWQGYPLLQAIDIRSHRYK